MPTYDYICKECGDKFEHFQSMSSSPIQNRPDCEVKKCNVERIISGGTGLIKNLSLINLKQKLRRKKIIAKKEKKLHEHITNYKNGKRFFACSR